MNLGRLLVWLGALCALLIAGLVGVALYIAYDAKKTLGRNRIAPAAKGRWPKDEPKIDIDETKNEVTADDNTGGDNSSGSPAVI